MLALQGGTIDMTRIRKQGIDPSISPPLYMYLPAGGGLADKHRRLGQKGVVSRHLSVCCNLIYSAHL
jgi:hypothetical protein